MAHADSNTQDGAVHLGEAEAQMKRLVEELESSYWVPFLHDPFKSLDEMLDGMAEDGTPLEQPFRAFVSNLNAAKELLEFPYLLLAPLVVKGSEVEKRLEELGPSGITEEVLEENIDVAHQLVYTVLRKSKAHLNTRPEILNRLMHQACLLAWGAFETYCKEVFIAALNKRPDLYGIIVKNQGLKERFALGQGSWPNLLEKVGYDLTGKLGTIIGSDKDFSSPQLVKDLFPVLISGLGAADGFLRAFEWPHLWLLGNRRHLIAHRCGIVDEEYLRKCDDPAQEAGKLLALTGKDMAQSLATVAGVAICMYGAARRCWLQPGDVK